MYSSAEAESIIIVNSHSSLFHAGRGWFTFLTSRSSLIAPNRPTHGDPFRAFGIQKLYV